MAAKGPFARVRASGTGGIRSLTHSPTRRARGRRREARTRSRHALAKAADTLSPAQYHARPRAPLPRGGRGGVVDGSHTHATDDTDDDRTVRAEKEKRLCNPATIASGASSNGARGGGLRAS